MGASTNSVVGAIESKGASNGESVMVNDAESGELQELGTEEFLDVHLNVVRKTFLCRSDARSMLRSYYT